MQYREATNRPIRCTTTSSLDLVEEKKPIQRTTAEQCALERTALCELNGIAQLEKFRHNISILRRTIKAELAKSNDSFILDDPAPSQLPIRVVLVRSRVRQTRVDPNTGYFHPVLNEWRPFSSAVTAGCAKRKGWLRAVNIEARYLKMRPGQKKSGVNKYSISLPVEGSLVF